MPNIKRMGRTMSKMKISPDIMAQMDFDADDRGNNVLPRIAVIDKMDELSPTAKTAVLNMRVVARWNVTIAKPLQEHKDKPPKSCLMFTVEYMMNPRLNDDDHLPLLGASERRHTARQPFPGATKN